MTFCPTTPAKLYRLGHDDYARDIVTGIGKLSILIQEANGWQRGSNAQALNADAIAMATPEGLERLVAAGRVEGYLMQISPFTQADWYRIDAVSVARDLLLCNDVMHYELSLSRSKQPKIECEIEEPES